MITISTKTLQLAGYVLPPDDVVLTKVAQNLTEEQKQQARDNIGVTKDAVLTTPQSLTEAQKQQARDNIGVTKDAVLTTPQTLTEEQKKQARDNIGAYSESNANITEQDLRNRLDNKSEVGHVHLAEDVLVGWKTDDNGEETTTQFLLNEKLMNIDSDLKNKANVDHDHHATYLRYDANQELTSDQRDQVKSNLGYGFLRRTIEPQVWSLDKPTSSWTDTDGSKAKFYILSIHDGNTDDNYRRTVTIMVDWYMCRLGEVITYYFPSVKIEGKYDTTFDFGYLTVERLTDDQVRFTVCNDSTTNGKIHGIRCVTAYY